MDMRMTYRDMEREVREKMDTDRQRKRMKILSAVFLGVCLGYLLLCCAFCLTSYLG